MGGAIETGVVVAIGVLSAVFIAALIALVVVLKKRYCKPIDLISQQYLDSAPDADLVGHSDDSPENASGLDLDDVLLPRNLDEILQNEVWANDAAGLMPHCLAILKIAHQLTDKLVHVTLSNTHQLQFPETLTDLVAVARRIGTRVDDVVRALYPPLDPRLLEARCSSLMLSVSHLVMLAKSASNFSGVLDWVDQSLADVEEHLKVLSEASLAYETGLQQRSSGAGSGKSMGNFDAWEKFTVDGDEGSSSSANLTCIGAVCSASEAAKESSQV